MKALVVGMGRTGSSFDEAKEKNWVNTHLGAYKKSSAIKGIAICDINQKALDKAIEFWNIKNAYNNIENALHEFSPEIVSLCVSADNILPLMKKLIKHSSVKLLWIEKPFSDSVENARKQIELLSQYEIRFLTNYQRRFDQCYDYAKENLNSLIGNPQKCVCFFSGGIVNTASHLVNLLLYFFGTPQTVRALNIKKDETGVDHGDFMLRFNACDAYAFEVNPSSSILTGAYSIFEVHLLGNKGKFIIKSLPLNGVDFDYYKASNSNFKGVKILKKEEVNINKERCYMEQELSTLIGRDDEMAGDNEGTLETLMILNKLGVME
jgi:predicted dehydrogenase